LVVIHVSKVIKSKIGGEEFLKKMSKNSGTIFKNKSFFSIQTVAKR
jgi:hypothetical protein